MYGFKLVESQVKQRESLHFLTLVSRLWFLNRKYIKPLVCLIAETYKDPQGVRRESGPSVDI